jgi:glutathione S-transferase
MSDINSPVKLYITLTSPYVRLARIVVLEKELGDKVEQIIAKTRQVDSPYYQVNPSGRVPCLILSDGTRLEESQLVCSYLDHLDAPPLFEPPTGTVGLQVRRLEAMARSLMDGVSVWIREGFRPVDERSPGIVGHEQARAARLIDVWENEIIDSAMQGDLNNMAQLTLITALQLEQWNPEFKWRKGHPRLVEWCDQLSDRPSLQETAPVL